jgi:nucleoside-diphosphate-sugar epimerase
LQMRQNILITGASGFIGSHLLKALSARPEYKIYCISRDPSRVRFLEAGGAEIIKADISEAQTLEKLASLNIDIIFHCAALVESFNLAKLRRVNVEGTKNICEFSIQKRVKKFIYLSSVAVISGNKDMPLTEDLPFSATNNYGLSKIETERVVLDYRAKGLTVCILRPAMVYGEDEPHMMRKILFLLKNRLLPLVRGGKSKFHLVYVKNVVAIMLYALERESMYSGVYFAVDKEVLTVKEVFGCFCRGIKAKLPLNLPPAIESFLIKIPVLGKKFIFFTKDRIYSTDNLERSGFKHPYAAEPSLIRSARINYYGKES